MEKKKTDPEKGIYISPDADVVGEVKIGEYSSVWYHAVVRADVNSVSIGKETNIQDGCVVHVDVNHSVHIGDRVTIGHRALIHGCTIGNETLIGMGAIILNGAKVGNNVMIGAGALVTQGMEIPDGVLAFGSPARVIRPLSEEEKTELINDAKGYVNLAREHFKESNDV